MTRLTSSALLVPLLGLGLLACGKRGDPLPPLRKVPAPVGGLKVAQRGDQIEVSFQAPGASTDGARLTSLDVEWFLAEGEGDFEKLAARHTRRADPGESVTERVEVPAPGTTVRVAARSLAGKRASTRTPVAGLVAQAVPAAPRGLTARLVGADVVLAWKGATPAPVRAALPTPTPLPGARPPGAPVPPAPPTHAPEPTGAAPEPPPSPTTSTPPSPAASTTPSPAPGAVPEPASPGASAAAPAGPPPFPGGFAVYRRGQGGVFNAPIAPPVETKSFTDGGPPLGQTLCYVVRAVSSLEPLVESASSDEACVAVADIVPPAVPGGLAVLPVVEGLELSWSPSPEADLAGYRILRAIGAGPSEPIAEVPPNQTQYVDKTAVRGTAYRYRLVAFDQAGNASAPGEPADGTKP